MRSVISASGSASGTWSGGAAVARYVTGAWPAASCSAKRLLPERTPPTISVRRVMRVLRTVLSPPHRPGVRGGLRESGKSGAVRRSGAAAERFYGGGAKWGTGRGQKSEVSARFFSFPNSCLGTLFPKLRFMLSWGEVRNGVSQTRRFQTGVCEREEARGLRPAGFFFLTSGLWPLASEITAS